MVQNDAAGPSKRRGRPPAYDREAALSAAMQTFWKAGYAGTSLDDLAEAMGMNRPSIYAAFGDKKALYLAAMDHYRRLTRASFDRAFEAGLPLCETLQGVVSRAIAVYVDGQAGPNKGCFVIGTAITEAAVDDEVKAVVADAFQELEVVMTERFAAAAAQGVNLSASPEVLGSMMSDLIHGCSLKARAGVARAEIEATARRTIEVICGRG